MPNDTTDNLIREPLPRSLGVSGLGGWLVLIQIGLYLTIVLQLAQLFQTLPAFSPETWEVVTSKDSLYYHALWAPVIIFETIYTIIFIIFPVYILIQFYQKKSILPRLMIIFYSASFLVGIIDFALLYQIPLARENVDGSGSLKNLIQSLIPIAIWIPYFIKSKRVQNTFVR